MYMTTHAKQLLILLVYAKPTCIEAYSLLLRACYAVELLIFLALSEAPTNSKQCARTINSLPDSRVF